MKHLCSSCFSFAELAALRSYQAAKLRASSLKPHSHIHQCKPSVLALNKAPSSSSTATPPPPPFQWGYDNLKNGPEFWPKYFPAGMGKQQSPINIETKSKESPILYDPALKIAPLKFSYDFMSARQLLNNQYTWQVNFDDSIDNILTGGPLKTPYNLFQMHVHWHSTDDQGSEHSINQKKQCAELHMVHYNKIKYGNIFEAISHPDGLAVLGIFLKIGERHEEFQKLVNHFPQILLPSQQVDIKERLNLCDMMPLDVSRYYTYQGSLTAPPLTESVTWILFPKPVEISLWQLRAFRRLHQRNWRPTQPLNDRQVRSTFEALNNTDDPWV